MASINSVLTYNANLSPAQAQLKALTGQVGALTAAFNTLDKSAVKAQGALASTFLANVGQIGGFTTQMVQSGTAVDNFGKALSKQRLTMRQYFREAFAGYTKQNSMMKQLAAQQVRMQQSMMVPMGAGPGGTGRAAVLTPTSVGAMGTAAAMASQKFSIFNELVRGGSERLLNFGKNTQWTGRQLMVGFTLPLVLFTGLVSKQFREIDKELTRFEKVYGADLVDTVDSSTEKMRERVKELAYEISSSFGIAAKETAALAADIAQTGKEGDDLIASVRQTTRLSVLGEVERQEAMRATLSIQNAFKLSTDELSESIDFLNAVENQTSTTLQDLAGAIPRVGPVIQALGGDIKDMSLLLVAMREGGVSAGEAANALKSGLGRLINPTKRARDVAAGFGVSLEDIIQNSRGQLLPMIFGLQDALSGLDDFARAQVLEKVFGKYQFARMAALFANLRRQGSQTLSVMELAGASTTELAGIANKEIRALQESSSMRFQRTIENLKNSLIPLGNMLTETLIPVLSAIGGGIKNFMEFFQNLPGPIKNFTKYAIALTAIAGPVVMLIGLFGNLIANGIKFGMMIVRMGAAVAGLRFEKFELLTADVIAARSGVDNLTTSFVSQETALKRLNTVMATYAGTIAHLMKTNPALFTPGALGAAGRTMPIVRRQKGSTSPEKVPGGYGGGDKVPALLEPGEFVVRKEAARGNVDFLRAMNRGQVRGYEFGDVVEARSPGRLSSGKIKHNAPDTIVKALVHDAQRQRMAEVVEEIARRAGIEFDSEDQRRQATKTHLAHYEKDMRAGLKYFDPANLLLTSGAENQAMEQLTRGNAGRHIISEIRRLGDSQPPLLKIDPQTGEIEVRQPKTPSQMRLMSNIVGSMIEQPDNRQIWGVSRSDVRQRVWGPLFKAIMEERMTGNGRLLPREIPLATNVAQAIRRAGGDIPAAARRSIALTESQVMGTTPIPPARGAARRPGIVGPGAVPPSMQRPSGPGPRPFVMTPRGAMLRVMPGEVMLPKPMYADYGAVVTPRGAAMPLKLPTAAETAAFNDRMLKSGLISAPTNAGGPQESLSSSRQAAQQQPQMMKGMGLMNIAFASSMLVGSMSMAGGASNDLAMQLGILSGAVMGAAAMMQMLSGKNVMGNFLGLGTLGTKMQGAGSAVGPASNLATGKATKGNLLFRAGGAVSMLGGPLGMGVAAALAAGVGGYMMYQKAAEQARERAVAAFRDPAKTAEFFGIQISDVTEKLKAASAQVEGVGEIDENLRKAVQQDYGILIEKIKFGGAEAGSRELSLAFNKMISSGLSEEQAIDAVKAISVEAGSVGGKAYAEALKQGLFEEKTAEELAQAMVDIFNPEKQQMAIQATQRTLEGMEKSAGILGRASGMATQNLDNTFGDFMTGLTSYYANINIPAQIIRSVTDFKPFEMMFNKDDMQEVINNASNTERQIHQMQTNIEEMADISSDSIVKITEIMFQNFKDAPKEVMESMDQIIKIARESTAVAFDPQPIKDFINEIDPISGAILSAMIGSDEELALKVMKAITSGMSIQDITDALMSGGPMRLEAEVVVVTNRAEIEDQINDLMSGITESGGELIEEEIDITENLIQESQKGLEKLDRQYERYEKKQRRIRNQRVRGIEKEIEQLEEQKEIISDAAELERERFEQKVDELNKEKDKINESTDAYINSIQKRQRADDFYANQRKTAFSALQKLASGDVFGFLQEREQMSQDAQQFAYDEQIKSIEDARDREIDSIDRTIEAEREKQEQFEKNTQDRIDLINEEIDAQREAADAAEELYEKRLRGFKRRQREERKSFTETINTQTTKLSDLRTIQSQIAEGQVIDAETVTKRLGEEFGKRYMEEMSIILKLRYQRQFDEAIRRQMESGIGIDISAAQREAARFVSGDYYALMGGRDVSGRPRTGQDPIDAILDWLGTVSTPQGQTYAGSTTPLPSSNTGTQGSDDTGTSGLTPGWKRNYQGDEVVGPDGRTYVWNPLSGQYDLKLGVKRGGFIKGPGTQTSDSIPARLSNGEYVVRASSVSKYGKGMMDAINEARFADGGYVDAGARRAMAEGKIPYQTRSVSNNLANQVGGYAGQVMRQPYQGVSKPGQKTNNTPYMGVPNSLILPQHLTPSMGIDINSQVNPVAEYANNPGSFVIDSLLGIKDDIADFVWHMFSDENEQVANRFGSFIRGMTEEEYSRISDDEKRIGAIFGASTFLPIPGVAGIRGIAAGVRSGIRAGSLSRAGGAGLKSSLSNAYASARSASKPRPNRFDPQYQEGVDPEEVIVNYLNSLPDKELPPGVRPFYVGKTVSPEVQSAYNKFLAHYVYKNADAQGVTRDIFWGKHSNLINMKNAVPEEGYIFGSDPNMDKFILQFYPSYKEGVPVNKVAWDDLVDSIFGGQGFGAGFDDPVKQLQVNSTRGSNPILELLGVSAHEGGHAIDFTNYYSLTDKRFLINPTERHQGIAEAAAEGNRIKVISELYKDAGLSAGHHNIIPYFKGYRGQANYGNTPSFKRTFLYNSLKNAFNKNSPFYWGNELSTAQKTRGLLRIARDAASSTFNYPYKFGILSAVEKNRRMRGVPPLTKNQALAGQLLFNSMQTLAGLGSVVNPILIKNLIDYLSTDDSPEMRMNIAEGFAEGGFVGKANPKFVSGMQLPSLIRSTQPDASASPGSSIYGGAARPTPTPSTNTSLIDHPSQGGPNGWPYSGFQTATGTIPGTGKKITMNKDVLPLFLAFASDYNRLIRPIDYVGGLAGRSGTFSNHPSGTAIDINANQEGVYFGWDWVPDDRKRAVLNWWKGQESPLANWSSPSSVPYKTVNDLMNKYKILQWFGPRSLGGFINDEMGNSDPMHFQITQSRRVSPGEVANTISSLGIRPDGTFNYAMGGFVSGPGGPRSDSIPARLSNGEYVVRASAVDKYGKGMLDQINSGQFGPSPKMFASGGMVGGMGYTQGGMVSPAFDVPSNNISMGGSSVVAARNTENFNNNSNVKIVINGANGNAQAIANKVVRMINQANNRRNHSRSTA